MLSELCPHRYHIQTIPSLFDCPCYVCVNAKTEKYIDYYGCSESLCKLQMVKFLLPPGTTVLKRAGL